jgi:hypothetical protein
MSELILIISVINIIFLFLGPIIVIAFVLVDRRKLKKPEGRGSVVTEYSPPEDLTPLQVSILLNHVRPGANLVAEIFYLIQQGFIKIEKVAPDYYISPIKTEKKPKYGFHDYLIEYIFKGSDQVKISDLKFLSSASATADPTFSLADAEARPELYASIKRKGPFWRSYLDHENFGGYYKIDAWARSILMDLGYIDKGLTTTRSKFVLVGLIGFLLGAFLGPFLFGLLVPGLILFFYGLLRPNLTQKGALMREYLMGYKDYLKMVEGEKLKVTCSPTSGTLYFPSYLPYAMALHLHDSWVKEFSGLFVTEEDEENNALITFNLGGRKKH